MEFPLQLSDIICGFLLLSSDRAEHWSVCERYSGAIFTFLSVTPVRDLPKYATLVVDKIAKSVAMLIY